MGWKTDMDRFDEVAIKKTWGRVGRKDNGGIFLAIMVIKNKDTGTGTGTGQ